MSNVSDVHLVVGIEMEEDIKSKAFVWTNEKPASNEDDITSCCIPYKQGQEDDIW